MGIDMNMPPQINATMQCIIEASIEYEIPADILLAVADIEGGKPYQAVRNTNGTHDLGLMQFNTSYIKELGKHGITQEHVMQNSCYPYRLAAWRIREHLVNDSGDIWQRAANYHSRTPKHNARYRSLLISKAQRWAGWLKQHFTLKKNVSGF